MPGGGLSACIRAPGRPATTRGRALLASLPSAGALLADRGDDANWFRNAVTERDIRPCIPSRKGRKTAIPHDAGLYRQRHKIENMFVRLKDWRRIATRCDRCAGLFLAAYNFARGLKTLGGLTPYEYICKIWTSEPDRFILNPIHQMPGLNT